MLAWTAAIVMSPLLHAVPLPKIEKQGTIAERTVFGGDVLTAAEAAERGAVIIDFTMGDRKSSCSGTLIHHNAAVLSAHCWRPWGSAGFQAQAVRFPGASGFETRPVRAGHGMLGFQPPEREGGAMTPDSDVGVLLFEGRAPAGYRPQRLLTEAALLSVGAEIEFVGGGKSLAGAEPDGSVRSVHLRIGQTREGVFSASSDPPGQAGGCAGDSGGAGFVMTPDGRVLAGISSSSTHPDCSGAHRTSFASVPRYAAWVERERSRLQAWLDEGDARRMQERVGRIAGELP